MNRKTFIGLFTGVLGAFLLPKKGKAKATPVRTTPVFGEFNGTFPKPLVLSPDRLWVRAENVTIQGGILRITR